jgi:hypothetical protein
MLIIDKKTNEVISISNLARKINLVFAVGGLINSLAVWIFGEMGITSARGLKIAAIWLKSVGK